MKILILSAFVAASALAQVQDSQIVPSITDPKLGANVPLFFRGFAPDAARNPVSTAFTFNPNQFSMTGVAGSPGTMQVTMTVGASWRGVYSASTSYSAGDVAVYNNSLFIATNGSIGLSPPNAQVWSAISGSSGATVSNGGGNVVMTPERCQPLVNQGQACQISKAPAQWDVTINGVGVDPSLISVTANVLTFAVDPLLPYTKLDPSDRIFVRYVY